MAGIYHFVGSREYFKIVLKSHRVIWLDWCVKKSSFWEYGFDWMKKSYDWMVQEVGNKLVRNAWLKLLKCFISTYIITNSRLVERVIRMKAECAHENVVVLLFIISAKKNLKQQTTTEENEREQRWWYELTDKTTNQWNEVKR